MNPPTVSGEEFICRCSYTQYFSLGEVLFISTGMVKLVEIISCGFILFIWEVGGKGGFFSPESTRGNRVSRDLGETYCKGSKLVIITLSGSSEEERFPTTSCSRFFAFRG